MFKSEDKIEIDCFIQKLFDNFKFKVGKNPKFKYLFIQVKKK